MKHQIATDTSQSSRLIACGVNISSADMYLEKSNIPPADYHLHTIAEGIDHEHWFKYRGNRDIIPAWSLSALLALLSMEINEEGLQTVFQLTPYPDELKWAAEYYDYTMDKYLCSERDYNPIEALVKAIERLTQKGYKLNNIKL